MSSFLAIKLDRTMPNPKKFRYDSLYYVNKAKKRRYDVYIDAAVKREKDFSLTLEQFIEICEKECHYCGVAPLSGGSNVWAHNGIDRKDNHQGYLIENCLPCCSICNRGKGTKSYGWFVAYIVRVSHNRQCMADLPCYPMDPPRALIEAFQERL
jgi:hypothetical protein